MMHGFLSYALMVIDIGTASSLSASSTKCFFIDTFDDLKSDNGLMWTDDSFE